MRTGNNIRQRKDGRFEARYKKGRDSDGHIIYGYCYGATYTEAENKRVKIIGNKSNTRLMNLLILGCGDHGNEVRELAESFRIFERIAFLDDGKYGQDDIIGPCSDLSKYVDEFPIAIVAIGDTDVRCRLLHELENAGFIIPTFIHPSANVSANAELGVGTVVCAGASVGYGAKIGKGCIIDSGAVVDRHAVVPDWTLVNCGEIIKNKN